MDEVKGVENGKVDIEEIRRTEMIELLKTVMINMLKGLDAADVEIQNNL